jgi:hypothetical protein
MSPNTDKDNTLNNRRKKDASDGKHGNNQFGFIIDAFLDALFVPFTDAREELREIILPLAIKSNYNVNSTLLKFYGGQIIKNFTKILSLPKDIFPWVFMSLENIWYSQ